MTSSATTLAAVAVVSKRREIRRWLRVDCQAVRAHDFRHVGGEIIDVSLGGIRVVPEVAAVGVGEHLIVSFEIDEDTFIDAEATVVHVAHNDSDGRARVELGLAFDELAIESRELLASRLSKIPPVVPRRASGTYEKQR